MSTNGGVDENVYGILSHIIEKAKVVAEEF